MIHREEVQLNLIPEEANQEPFEIFWNSGMRKLNKKKAKTIFSRLGKASGDALSLAMSLRFDIQTRIKLKQFGFDSMHPTTYLNGERWEDEMPKASVQPRLTKDITLEERLTDTSWADDIIIGGEQ